MNVPLVGFLFNETSRVILTVIKKNGGLMNDNKLESRLYFLIISKGLLNEGINRHSYTHLLPIL